MRRGQTLIEVLVALIILALGVVALTASSSSLARTASLNKSRAARTLASQDSIELLRAAQ